jgi:hypothetical protein
VCGVCVCVCVVLCSVCMCVNDFGAVLFLIIRAVKLAKPHVNEFSFQCIYYIDQRFSTSVRPRPGKIFFHKTRARSQQVYS